MFPLTALGRKARAELPGGYPPEFCWRAARSIGYARVRRSAVRGVVLEASIIGRIVRGRDHNSIGEAGGPRPIETQNGVGNGRRGSEPAGGVHHHVNPIGRENFQRGHKTALRKSMRVLADKERAFDLLLFPVFADRLGDGQNVVFVEAALER